MTRIYGFKRKREREKQDSWIDDFDLNKQLELAVGLAMGAFSAIKTEIATWRRGALPGLIVIASVMIARLTGSLQFLERIFPTACLIRTQAALVKG